MTSCYFALAVLSWVDNQSRMRPSYTELILSTSQA